MRNNLPSLSENNIMIRPISYSDTDMIVRWRNNERVRSNLIRREMLTTDVHLNWMKSEVETGSVVQYIIEYDGRPVGTVFYKDINRLNNSAEFGIFIGDDKAIGHGVGKVSTRLFIQVGFEELGLHKIFLRHLRENNIAHNTYLSCGFREEGVFKDMVYIDGSYHDVVFMAIIANREIGINGFLNKDNWDIDEYGTYISSETTATTTFSEELQNELWRIEDGSWWFQYRAGIILEMIDRFYSRNKLTLDVGGGNGYTSKRALDRGYNIGLIEPSLEACHNARIRGLTRVYCGTVKDDIIKDNSIDQMMLLDVLEHIEDDEGFVKTLNKKIKTGGYILVTVPAFRCLWSSEDDVAGHFRRYRLSGLCNILENSGFDICYRSYFMGFLFVPVLVVRVLFEKLGIIKKQSERSDEERRKIAKMQFESPRGLVSLVLRMAEGVERLIMKRMGIIPFGSSIIIVAQKPV